MSTCEQCAHWQRHQSKSDIPSAFGFCRCDANPLVIAAYQAAAACDHWEKKE